MTPITDETVYLVQFKSKTWGFFVSATDCGDDVTFKTKEAAELHARKHYAECGWRIVLRKTNEWIVS